MPPDPDPCELLPWDSNFFGFRVARVVGHHLTESRHAAIDAWCRDRGVRCLYFLAANDPGTTDLAERLGYDKVEVRVTYGRVPPATAPAVVSIRPFRVEDLPALERIAATSHTDTRFFFDRRFPPARATDLYVEWLRVSTRRPGSTVLVADRGGHAAGYVTCDTAADGTRGGIGLIAVDPAARGKGLGRALVDAALAHFSARRIPHVTVVTQGRNFPAQRLYESCGFTADLIQLYYHRWYADDGTSDAPAPPR